MVAKRLIPYSIFLLLFAFCSMGHAFITTEHIALFSACSPSYIYSPNRPILECNRVKYVNDQEQVEELKLIHPIFIGPMEMNPNTSLGFSINFQGNSIPVIQGYYHKKYTFDAQSKITTKVDIQDVTKDEKIIEELRINGFTTSYVGIFYKVNNSLLCNVTDPRTQETRYSIQPLIDPKNTTFYLGLDDQNRVILVGSVKEAFQGNPTVMIVSAVLREAAKFVFINKLLTTAALMLGSNVIQKINISKESGTVDFTLYSRQPKNEDFNPTEQLNEIYKALEVSTIMTFEDWLFFGQPKLEDAVKKLRNLWSDISTTVFLRDSHYLKGLLTEVLNQNLQVVSLRNSQIQSFWNDEGDMVKNCLSNLAGHHVIIKYNLNNETHVGYYILIQYKKRSFDGQSLLGGYAWLTQVSKIGNDRLSPLGTMVQVPLNEIEQMVVLPFQSHSVKLSYATYPGGGRILGVIEKGVR